MIGIPCESSYGIPFCIIGNSMEFPITQKDKFQK